MIVITQGVLITACGSLGNTDVPAGAKNLLFVINRFLIVALVGLAFFFNMNRPDRITTFFFFGVLGLVVSELMLFYIYFLEMHSLK